MLLLKSESFLVLVLPTTNNDFWAISPEGEDFQGHNKWLDLLNFLLETVSMYNSLLKVILPFCNTPLCSLDNLQKSCLGQNFARSCPKPQFATMHCNVIRNGNLYNRNIVVKRKILQNLQKKRCSGPLFAKSTTIHYNNFPRELIKKIHDNFALSTLNSLFRQSSSCESLSVSRPVLISKSSQGRRQTCVLAASDQADLHPRPHSLPPLSHNR